MLAERAGRWKAELLEQGIERGIEQGKVIGRVEGRNEGRLEGERAILISLLTQKFGELPSWVEQHLELVDGQQIQAITRGLLAANRLEDLIPLKFHDVE